jgi:hypothetical protein
MAKVRKLQEIEKEYQQKLFQLGNLQWQLDKIPRQIEDLQRILKSLDSEDDEAHRVEVKAAQEKTAKTLAEQKAKDANGKDKNLEQAPAVTQ